MVMTAVHIANILLFCLATYIFYQMVSVAIRYRHRLYLSTLMIGVFGLLSSLIFTGLQVEWIVSSRDNAIDFAAYLWPLCDLANALFHLVVGRVIVSVQALGLGKDIDLSTMR